MYRLLCASPAFCLCLLRNRCCHLAFKAASCHVNHSRFSSFASLALCLPLLAPIPLIRQTMHFTQFNCSFHSHWPQVEEYSDEVFDLLNNGAHIYFCGLKGMMPGEWQQQQAKAQQQWQRCWLAGLLSGACCQVLYGRAVWERQCGILVAASGLDGRAATAGTGLAASLLASRLMVLRAGSSPHADNLPA